MSDLMDAIDDGWAVIERIAADIWDGLRIALRPLDRFFEPLGRFAAGPFEAWERRHYGREAEANFALAAQLEQVGLADSATKVRDLAAEQLVRGRGQR